MKNLKTIFRTALAVLAFLTVHLASAQFYLKLRGGYNAPAGRTEVHSWGNQDIFGVPTQNDKISDASEGNATVTRKILKESLGQGLNFALEGKYMFNKRVGAALEIGYTLGNEAKGTINAVGLLNADNYVNTISSDFLTLTPSFILDAGNETFSPYLSIGAVIGFPKVKETIVGNYDGNLISYENQLYGGTALGFSAGLGGRYNLNSTLSLFVELRFTSLQYSPKYRDVKVYDENGQDALGTKFPQTKENLGNEELYEVNNQGQTLSTHALPLGSANLSLGIIYGFGKK